MTVIELILNNDFSAGLSNVSPFVYVGYTRFRTLKTAWGTSCDDIFDEGIRTKVRQVTQDYLSKYIQVTSLAECEAQEMSFYFDSTNQKAYLHIEHTASPITTPIDHGYTFGVCSGALGDVYIDDLLYLGLIKESPDMEVVDDGDAPVGLAGSLTLNNVAEIDETTGLPTGPMDFLFDNRIYNNDIFVYDYDGTTLTPTGTAYVENLQIGEEEVTIDLQSRRFQ